MADNNSSSTEADSSTLMQNRLDRAQEALEREGADALILFPSSNMGYLSGFQEEPMERHLFLFVTREETLFLAPEMYDEQLAAESVISTIRTWSDGDDPTALLAEIGGELEIASGRLLVDDTMWALFTQDLRETFPDATFGLASEVVDELRLRKDDAELEHLREAAAISDRVSEAIRGLGEEAIGMTEAELADAIEQRLTAAGGEGTSFETVVGSGPNGARPHHRHTDRQIERGDPVVLDFGTRVEGYPGDQTRTIVFDGEPPADFENVHEAVLTAQQAALDAVEPGVEAQAIDRAAREVLENRGYGEQFVHRTGHGVGRDVHEPPYITEGNDRVLEPGMVFSIEPGVYLDGEFGVRIEDLVVVTEDGCERLNRSPREW
ncbi:putative Xaa-Pro dipeptidase (plasmid) [Natrialba magadii ATCC 43099]|uniref:Peptidase M24 n=1 Tax=Natrialba magadii (strain ATCC 43099 / DSM 3394 / CCM 3739 / CIP 104546 / IAM 13178 / JCM 8861 / NBRC 102185 / NCIMB 2190 / MS3) TaxID=547559 RepID=D3T1N4_NATMM|nr:Xaa-Pro peptidase family protein [Natrialba magadii]ADD07493.1 putative Xaa-Pro dipeptidase [Natrialba magadii ATCC 43099]ELY32210.1 peptidase M24 [Natrialba magadii ATCC 43099]